VRAAKLQGKYLPADMVQYCRKKDLRQDRYDKPQNSHYYVIEDHTGEEFT
jgi:hypothetical protein